MNDEDRKLINGMLRTLGGIEESTRNIYHLTEKQERHLAKLNDSVAGNSKAVAVNGTRIKMLMWVIGTLIVGGGGVAGLVNLLG